MSDEEKPRLEGQEQKRTILVIISICVVALAVVGVSLWLFYPKASSNQPVSTYVQGLDDPAVGNPAPTQPETVGQAPDTGVPPQHQTQSQELVIVYGEPTYQVGPDGKLVRINKTPAPAAPESAKAPESSPVPSPVPPLAAGQSQSQTMSATVHISGDGPPKVVAAPQPAKVREAPSPAPAAAVKRPVSASVPAGEELWIQIISSPNRDRVEQVKKDLSVLGFNGRVSTRQVNGIDYYRLRFGPYSKKDEAQKFLDWVKAIRGFEQSYISQEKSGN